MIRPQYDIIVFGATSFAGQILAHYLIGEYGNGKTGKLKWAAAGRSNSKLQKLRSSLGSKACDLDLLVADATSEEDLKTLCVQTSLIISTVGPYAVYGELLVKACVKTGTDYCDLTAEVLWIRRMIECYQAEAEKSGARIVHCCGFDSIPSDMGVYYLQQQAMQRFGAYCSSAKLCVKAARGGFSGGSFAGILNLIEETEEHPELAAELEDIYSICPPGHVRAIKQHSINAAQYDTDLSCWVAPFILAPTNERVVLRSNALAGYPYGEQFTYNESIITAPGLTGKVIASIIAASSRFFTFAIKFAPLRGLLTRVMPAPGEGPSPEAQEKGHFNILVLGETQEGKKLTVEITADRDPGYGATVRMLAQAAISLVEDVSKDEKAGGFWTTATIFDQRFIERLRENAGVVFEVCE